MRACVSLLLPSYDTETSLGEILWLTAWAGRPTPQLRWLLTFHGCVTGRCRARVWPASQPALILPWAKWGSEAKIEDVTPEAILFSFLKERGTELQPNVFNGTNLIRQVQNVTFATFINTKACESKSNPTFFWTSAGLNYANTTSLFSSAEIRLSGARSVSPFTLERPSYETKMSFRDTQQGCILNLN